VRQGLATPEAVRAAVYAEVREGIAWSERRGYACERERDILHWLQADYDGSLDYARWAIEYERLPPGDKARIKAGRAQEGIDAWMDRQEPTAKQVAYLRGRGYTGPIHSRRHASALIDILMRGGKVTHDD